MPEQWDFYMMRVDNKPASVFGNFGLAGEAPKRDKPWLLLVFVQLKFPNDDGLTTKEEADDLWKVEDALVPAVQEQLDAQFVGRITTDSRRDFFFYASRKELLDVVVAGALVPLGYSFDSDARHDPKWRFYFDTLYPSAVDWNVMLNRRVIKNLTDNGDDLSQPRGVHHYVYFTSTQDRARFVAAARERGFRCRIFEPEKSDKARPFGLNAHRVDTVSQPAIDDVCYELITLAQEYGGDYDGWETQMLKPGESPKEDAPTET